MSHGKVPVAWVTSHEQLPRSFKSFKFLVGGQSKITGQTLLQKDVILQRVTEFLKIDRGLQIVVQTRCIGQQNPVYIKEESYKAEEL